MDHLPQDFADALAQAGLDNFFAACTGAHRREYVTWIAAAKRPETRKERIRKALGMISDRRAEPTARAKKNQ